MVVRNGEDEDLPVDLTLALDSTEELDDALHCKIHTASVLPVCDIERLSVVFHLASQEREVRVVCDGKDKLVPVKY